MTGLLKENVAPPLRTPQRNLIDENLERQHDAQCCGELGRARSHASKIHDGDGHVDDVRAIEVQDAHEQNHNGKVKAALSAGTATTEDGSSEGKDVTALGRQSFHEAAFKKHCLRFRQLLDDL